MRDQDAYRLLERALAHAYAHPSGRALRLAGQAVEAWRLAEEARSSSGHERLLRRSEALAAATLEVRPRGLATSGAAPGQALR